MAEEHHRGPHAYESLAVEAKDKQGKNEVGLKVKGADLVVLEDGVEELVGGRNQPSKEVLEEEVVDGPRQTAPRHGAGPNLGGTPLIAVADRQREHRIEVLLLSDGEG